MTSSCISFIPTRALLPTDIRGGAVMLGGFLKFFDKTHFIKFLVLSLLNFLNIVKTLIINRFRILSILVVRRRGVEQ